MGASPKDRKGLRLVTLGGVGVRGTLRLMALLAAPIALAACAEGPDPDAEVSAQAAPASDLALGDVEAPDAFQVTEEGLWDGRPSLGGTWVAHPDVADPERVIVRNEENGQSVVGALFRRERANSGPALQVSSDAAEALGMLAGAPARLSVTALRREEPEEGAVPVEPATEALPDDVPPGDPLPDDEPAADGPTGSGPADDMASTAEAIVAASAVVPPDPPDPDPSILDPTTPEPAP